MRARVVLYNQKIDSILLIHRQKNGRDYWVIPGGGGENRETPTETAIREVFEELNIRLIFEDLTFLFETDDNEYIFLAKTELVEAPKISGEEKDRATFNNVYEPLWVKVSRLASINLMPPKIAKQIMTAIK